MPLNSVQLYVAGLITAANIIIDDGIPALDCWIVPPTLQNMNGPHAYVWGGRVSTSRQTMPRGVMAGFKKYPWQIDVYVVFETVANRIQNPNLDSQFPMLIDAITNIFSTTTMPGYIDTNGVFSTEPVAGASQIQHIGESWTLDYPAVHTPRTMKMSWFSANIVIDVLEVVQQ